MYKVTANNFVFDIETSKTGFVVNSAPISLDISTIRKNTFHALYGKKSYPIEIISTDRTKKSFVIKVKGHVYNIDVKDQFDELLSKLGLDNINSQKVSEIKAPMPGLVLKVLVNVGDHIEKGGNLLLLEAMKMENIIKSPGDVTVKSIHIVPGDKVEKNQVLIVFE